MSPQAGVRVGIVCIFAVLTTVFVVEDARSQPTRPGGIPRPPSFPKPPTFTPPTFTPPNIPRGPLFENVWSCGKCKAELGRGNVKPSYDSCPKCGVRFINGGGGGGTGGFGLVNPPPPVDNGNSGNNSQPPSFGNAAPADPDLIPRGNSGASNNGDAQSFTAPKSTPDSGTVTAAEEKPTSKTGSIILKIMIGVFALLFLIGIAGGIFLIAAANKGSKPTKKSRRRIDDEDDD